MIPWDWGLVTDKSKWLEPSEECYYYAEKWKREGRKSVLDLGCGLGRHSVFFAKSGFKTTALDLSEDAIRFLKKYQKEQNVDILCKVADMEHLPFADSAFDAVFAMHSAGHTDTEGMFSTMSEIKRVLKSEGTVFMTLCSKETWSFKECELPCVDANTRIKTKEPEKGVPHFFADQALIDSLFSDFQLIKVRHIDDCFSDGRWKNEKHYFIEATIHKEETKPDYSDVIGSIVKCKIDRPLGCVHPRHPDLVYPVNYGYVPGIFAGDGAEQDVYILGVDKPLEEFTGKVLAVYHRFNDIEDKWIVASEGLSLNREEILQKIEFQEKFFDGELYGGSEK